MIPKILLSAIFVALSTADAATRVAVIEIGKAGAVKKTNSKDTLTTVAGVSSFWSALHSPGRRLQHAGMALVPDLFNRADGGMVLGLKGNGVDLDAMPFVKSLLSDEGSHGVVGHLDLNGNKGDALLEKVLGAEDVDATELASKCKGHAMSSGLTGMKTVVESKHSAIVDAQLRDLITSLDQELTAAGTTMVLHLVVEEEEGSARRRLLSRRLEDKEEDEGENQDQNQDADGNNGNAKQNNGYYGYGYYNAYGEWVSLMTTLSLWRFYYEFLVNHNFSPRLGHPLQDNVPDPILQRRVVDLHWVDSSSLLHCLPHALYAPDGTLFSCKSNRIWY
jgi:hypothetical protein